MSSPLRNIADALAASLAAVEWSDAQTTVQRKNWVDIDAADMPHPVIFVAPGGAEITRLSRLAHQTDYTVNVFIGRRAATEAEADAMLDMTEAAIVLLRAHAWGAVQWPAGITSPVALSVELNPDDALSERNCWRAVVSATYRSITQDSDGG
jgi:hypothetical protein